MSREIIMLTVSIGGFLIMSNLNAYFDRLEQEQLEQEEEEAAQSTAGDEDTDDTNGPETKKD